MLFVRRWDETVTVRVLNREDVPDAMVYVLETFASEAGYSGFTAPEEGIIHHVVVASVQCYGAEQTTWAAWLPAGEVATLDVNLSNPDGYEELARGRAVLTLTDEDFCD